MLTDRHRDEYAQREWTVVRNFLSGNELAKLRSEALRLQEAQDLLEARGGLLLGDRRKDRIDPVSDVSSPIAGISVELAALAREVLGAPVKLVKDKLILKLPGSPGYSLHQDFAYYQGMGFKPDCACTIALFLDDSTDENGAIEFAEGTGWKLLTPEGELQDPDPESFGSYLPCYGAAGDALIFSTLVPHRSDRNHSTLPRRTIFFLYAVDLSRG